MLSKSEIEKLALSLRSQMKIDISEPVPDIVSLLKSNNFEYLEDSFRDDFSGFSQALGNGKYLIGFNADKEYGPAFKRFTIAHELGHVSIPEHRELLEETTLHRSNDQHLDRSSQIEKEADTFAAAFLSPAPAFTDFIKDLAPTDLSIKTVANYFGISLYAAALRYIDLTNRLYYLFVVSDTGTICFERRSALAAADNKARYLSNIPIPLDSHISMFFRKETPETEGDSSITLWHPDRPPAPCREAVIDLRYNGKFVVFVS